MAEMKALIPAMTSNTTPKGECFGSGANQSASNYQFYHAFCGDNTKFWANDGNPTGYIGYDFGKPVRCYRFRFNPLTYHTAATITYKIQATNDINGAWTDVSELQTINTSSAILYNGEYSVNAECDINPGNGYRYYRYKQESTNYGNSNAGAMQFYGTDETPHLKSSGSTEAIRDWLNASLYNKEEIDDLFIQNNQSGLIPYDLMITGDQPEQFIKLVGQTSGKTYNICLAAILGEMAMDRFNINEHETQGKFLDGSDICGWAVPFFKNGAAESHWSNSGNIWTNSEINSDTIDDLLYAFVINQNQQGVYSFGTGTIQWNKASGNFTLNFSTSYNTWIMLIYTKP